MASLAWLSRLRMGWQLGSRGAACCVLTVAVELVVAHPLARRTLHLVAQSCCCLANQHLISGKTDKFAHCLVAALVFQAYS